LELLRTASARRLDVYDEPLIREMGRYIYRAHISADYFINFSDAGAKEQPDASLVYRFGQRIGDERMMAFPISGPVSDHGPPRGRNAARCPAFDADSQRDRAAAT
jgi:hypothetical protein